MTRTVLVHLNIELPDTAPATADDVADEVRGALEVAAEGDHVPALTASVWDVALAEEI